MEDLIPESNVPKYTGSRDILYDIGEYFGKVVPGCSFLYAIGMPDTQTTFVYSNIENKTEEDKRDFEFLVEAIKDTKIEDLE